MKTNFTPGKWGIEGITPRISNIVSNTTPRSIICSCDIPEFGSKFANLSLIAAAPAMYDALEAMYNEYYREGYAPDSPLTKALAALAAARGEK